MRPTDVIHWLLDTDPALRWQVERDLLDAPEEQWQATRARIPQEGYGAALLDRQDPATGLWAGGAFFPAGFLDDPESRELPGQPWTATTWSLTTLREWGMDPAPLVARDTAAKLAEHAHWELDPSLPYWGGEVDVCINAMTLANGLWLGADVSSLPDWFVEHTMDEGGWNCEWQNGSRRHRGHPRGPARGGGVPAAQEPHTAPPRRRDRRPLGGPLPVPAPAHLHRAAGAGPLPARRSP